MEKCKNCGSRKNLIYVLDLGYSLCEVCYEDGVFVCEDCKKAFWEEEKDWEYINDKKYCVDCYKSIMDFASRCAGCGKWVWGDDFREKDGKKYCWDCLKKMRIENKN